MIVTNENSSDEKISTGGGAAVSGNVDTGGGAFAGRDIINNIRHGKKSRGGTDLHSQIAQVQDEIFEFGNRLVEIEKVLGGQWGMPGVVAKVDNIHEKLDTIDERLASRERAWLAIVGLLSTLNLALFAILYIFWRA